MTAFKTWASHSGQIGNVAFPHLLGHSAFAPGMALPAPQRPLPAPPNNRAVGQLVIRFGVPEGKSEVSYLSQFRLLNATDIVWLNL
jgi:hypothetical protein